MAYCHSDLFYPTHPLKAHLSFQEVKLPSTIQNGRPRFNNYVMSFVSRTVKVFFFTTVIALWSFQVCAQDPVFSQFHNAPLQLNPAMAGLTDAPSFNINYRNQWPGLNNAYRTYALSYDQHFPYINSSFGLHILADDAGDGILKTNKVSGIYAYHVRVQSDFYLKMGLEASYVQSRLDWNRLVFLDQLDPRFGPLTPGGTPIPSTEVPPEDEKLGYLDIGMGGLAYTPLLYVGFSLRHLNSPNQSFLDVNDDLYAGVPLRWSVHAGSEITIIAGNNQNRGTFISPGIMYVRQAGFSQVNAGATGSMGMFHVGLWYRQANKTSDAVIATAGIRKGLFKVTYSYDITISGLGIDSGGSHELGIQISFDDGKSESIYNDCFSIFR